MQELRTRVGRPALVLEVSRLQCGAECTSQDVAGLAQLYKEGGADAIAVLTDGSPNGLGDLFATCRAVQSMPVLHRDWFLHPLQVTPCSIGLNCLPSRINVINLSSPHNSSKSLCEQGV